MQHPSDIITTNYANILSRWLNVEHWNEFITSHAYLVRETVARWSETVKIQ